MNRALRLIRWPALAACLLALAPAVPRAADCIDWPKALTWDDFKGPVPPHVTKAARDARQAHDQLERAKADLQAAKDELSRKQAERQGVIDERKAEFDKIDAEFDPKIRKASEERAKAAETPDDAKAKATDAVNNDAKLDAKAKAGKLKKIESDYQAAKKKFDNPANAKAREAKLAGLDKTITGLESQKSAKRGAVNDKFDKKLDPIDKEIERLNRKVAEQEGELQKAEDADEKAQEARSKVEMAATSATPTVGKLEMEACGKIKDLPVKAVFCPDRSYVEPETKKAGSPGLLQHEQVHFNLAEKHARLFRQEVRKLIDAFNAKIDNLNKCQPKDLKEAVEKAKADFKKDLAAAQAKAEAAHNAEQEAYDHDPAKGPPADGTAHGTNDANQKAWNDKIADELKPK